MTVLDAYAVVAFLDDEPAGSEVRGLLRAGECATTVLVIAEVTDFLMRRRGVDRNTTAAWLATLELSAESLDADLGASAGRLRAQRYHRVRCSVSMADCVAAVTARHLGEPLATSDPHLLDVCHAEGIEIVVLPGTDGSRWTPPTNSG